MIKQLRTPEFYTEQIAQVERKYPKFASKIRVAISGDYHVLGHTHNDQVGPPTWNTGAWVDNSACRCFAIRSDGQVEFSLL